MAATLVGLPSLRIRGLQIAITTLAFQVMAENFLFVRQDFTAAGKTLEVYREEAGSRTMLKRPGTPQEVAACILFLASDEASYVTGTCLFVDGGHTAM